MIEPEQKRIWWIRPDAFLLGVAFPLAILVSVSANSVLSSNKAGYDVANYLGLKEIVILFYGLFLIFAGASFGSRIPTGSKNRSVSGSGLWTLFLITCFGYIVWFQSLVLNNFEIVLGTFIGQQDAVYAARELAKTLPGVTTFTQFGVSFACIYSLQYVRRATTKTSQRQFLVIIVLSFFRAVVFSERLALIEVTFPFLIAYFLRLNVGKGLLSSLLSFARFYFPFLLIMGGAVVFTLFEYFRSWVNAYNARYDSLWQFGFERFSIYYISALNNIAGFMRLQDWPTMDGYFTLNWLYKFPLVGSYLVNAAGVDYRLYDNFLFIGADPEFNNPSAILPVFNDWGLFFGGVFLLVYGVLAGNAYRSFKVGSSALAACYPIFLYSFFELMRVGYIYDARTVVSFLGIAFAYLFFSRRVAGRH